MTKSWYFLKRIFQGKNYKGSIQWTLAPTHQVQLSFIHKDVEYYSFVTGYTTYYERFMAAMDYLSMLRAGVDKPYMDEYEMAMQEYLNRGDLYNASILHANLKERRKWVLNTEMVYHLAAVFYFDKSENPYTFSPEYAAEKILRWKKDKEMMAFFLKSPIAEFLPPLNISDEDIQSYTKAQRLVSLAMLKSHLLKLSKGSKNQEMISTLKSQLQELEELVSMT